jgi:hypothetical protein
MMVDFYILVIDKILHRYNGHLLQHRKSKYFFKKKYHAKQFNIFFFLNNLGVLSMVR